VRPVEDSERDLVLAAMKQHGRMTCDKIALILADPKAAGRSEFVLRALEAEGKVECVDEWTTPSMRGETIRSYTLREANG
jgi:predicted ArsR family transcriptional regulator